MDIKHCRGLIGLVAGVLVMLAAGHAQAAAWNYFTASYGNWTNAANWGLSRVPAWIPSTTTNDRPRFTASRTAVIDSATPSCGYVLLGGSGSPGYVVVSNGTLTTTSDSSSMYLYNDSKFTLVDGTVAIAGMNCANAGTVVGATDRGAVEVRGGTLDLTYDMVVAECNDSDLGMANGLLDVSGGTVTVHRDIFLGGQRAASRSLEGCLGSTGTVTMTGGDVVVKVQAYLGRDGQAVLDISGGEFFADCEYYVHVGQRFNSPYTNCASGTINVSGTGSVIFNPGIETRFGEGWGGSAYLNVNGGKFASYRQLKYNYGGTETSTGRISVAGGEFYADELSMSSIGDCSFIVSGGTATAGVVYAAFAVDTVTQSGGSLTILTNITVGGAANGGEVFELGDGVKETRLTLKGEESSMFGSGLLINTNATLAAAGFLNANVTNLSTLAPGASVGDLELTYGKSLTLAADSVLEIEFASTNDFDTITMNGVLTRGGLIRVITDEMTGEFRSGQRFTIIANSGSAGGEFAGFTEDSAVYFEVDNTLNPNGLDLVATVGPGTLIVLE